MSYFEKVADSAFKETEDGLCIYYPNGVIGKGRVVTSPELKKKIYTFHKNTMKYGILLGIISGFFLKISVILVILLIALPIFYFYQHQLIGSLEVHNSKHTVQEIYNKANPPNWYGKLLLALGMLGLMLSLITYIIFPKFYLISIILSLFSIMEIAIYFYLKKLGMKKFNKPVS